LKKTLKYLIIGHPRCGSGFTAHLFSKLGIPASHETEPINKSALSSWAFNIEHEPNDLIKPRYGIDGWGWRGKYSFKHTITHLRNPFDALPSIINENEYDWSFHIRNKYIKKITHKRVSGSPVERAILGYIYWNKIAINKSEFYFRIESEEDFQSLVIFLQSKNEDPQSIDFTSLKKVNSKPLDKKQIEKDQYKFISSEIKSELFDFCAQYGYEYIL
jgi:hypothetical protein